MSLNTSRWAQVSFLAAATFALALAPEANAQSGRGRRHAGMAAAQGGGRGNRNAMANQGNMVVARSLQQTLQLLAQADHDYQGHRVLAMRHVQTAIHQLVPGAARGGQQNQMGRSMANGGQAGGNGNGNANGAPGGRAGKNRMPQATSDQHLQQALQSLTAIHGHIMGNGSTPNHARAVIAIESAVRELNIALGIR